MKISLTDHYKNLKEKNVSIGTTGRTINLAIGSRKKKKRVVGSSRITTTKRTTSQTGSRTAVKSGTCSGCSRSARNKK